MWRDSGFQILQRKRRIVRWSGSLLQSYVTLRHYGGNFLGSGVRILQLHFFGSYYRNINVNCKIVNRKPQRLFWCYVWWKMRWLRWKWLALNYITTEVDQPETRLTLVAVTTACEWGLPKVKLKQMVFSKFWQRRVSLSSKEGSIRDERDLNQPNHH